MPNMKNIILEQLKSEILNLTLKPGTVVSEATLSDRFGISRTPIRDILKQLSLEGYIDIYPQRGSVVSYIDLDSVEQLIFLRSTLEKEIAKTLGKNLSLKSRHELQLILAKQKDCLAKDQPLENFLALDDLYHRTLFAEANRSFIWDMIQQFKVHYIRYRQLNMLSQDKLNAIYNEHQQLFNYILADNQPAVNELLELHLHSHIDSQNFLMHYSEYIRR
ncbi:MAG: GntR family transcriptional regulator [Vallitaleaceae bacterium]|nr:GntR family transcriptional regulator [Vallitaleaceae bacterium]